MITQDDEDLPPSTLSVGELVTWIAAKIGRRPTLEEIAAVRYAVARRAMRRQRRHAQQRYRWPTRGDVPAASGIVREILGGPEMAPFWSAVATIAAALPRFVSQSSAGHGDEWLTQHDTVLRLAAAIDALSPSLSTAPEPGARRDF